MISLALSSTSIAALLMGSTAAVPFSPTDLFASNEPGVWFDPSDLTTLFQDPAGTTPVTAPGQTVGLMLDKSKGLVLGSELVVNGDFASATGWTQGAGWSIGSGVATATATNGYLYQTVASVAAGKYYEYTVTITSYTSGTLRFFAGSGAESLSTAMTASGTYTLRVCSRSASQLGVVGIAFTGTIDNISVRELAGNHATQATPAARPNYAIEPAGGRRNLLTFSEDFSQAIWVKLGTTASAHNVADPDGGTTASTITATTTGGYFYYNTSANPASNTAPSLWIRRKTGTGVIRLRTNAVGVGTDTPITVTSSWQRVAVTCVAGNAASNQWVLSIDASGDAVDIWHPQLELGSTATNYQKVTTTYDVTEAGVASMSYLYFDGVNDAMATSTITPGIDKAQVFAGVRKTGPTVGAFGVIAEFSPIVDSNPGSLFLLSGSFFGTQTQYSSLSRGNAAVSVSQGAVSAASFTAPTTDVLTSQHDISGDLSAMRVDGVASGTNGTGDQGTGNFLAYPLYLGFRQSTANFYFVGHLYSLITRFGATLDTPTITNTETWVAGKTGFFTPVITGVPTIGVS